MIDAMDKKLVRSLNANARKSFREIAKELGTSTTSVIRGIKKLESSGAVRGYIPVVDPAAFGYDLTVVVLMAINQGQLLETQRKIAQEKATRSMKKAAHEPGLWKPVEGPIIVRGEYAPKVKGS